MISRQQRHYQANKQAILAASREKYKQNASAIREQRRLARLNETDAQKQARKAYHKSYNMQHRDTQAARMQTDEYKFIQYQSAALRRGYTFSLDFSSFVALFHASCTYCGMVKARGIDRIDNDEGYEPENVTPCCEMCNKMKWRFSKNAFLAHAKAISSFNIK